MNTFPLRLSGSFVHLWRLLIIAMVVQGGGFHIAQAFKLTPMKMTLAPQGKAASGVFVVNNDSNDTLAVDIHFLTRSMSPDGVEINERADEQFMVFPPQFALHPQKSQTVRIKWIGKAPIEKEMAFRLVAEQLPVRLNKGASGGVNLNVAIRYLAAVYVQPKGAKEKIVLKAEKVNSNSQEGLLLDIGNRGTRHAILRELSVELSCQGETVKLSTDQISGIHGENLLAGATRRIRLPWPSGLPVGDPSAHFDYRK